MATKALHTLLKRLTSVACSMQAYGIRWPSSQQAATKISMQPVSDISAADALTVCVIVQALRTCQTSCRSQS